MSTYWLDATGRRTALLLILGAALVWIVAIWKLPAVLSSEQVRVTYSDFVTTLGAALAQGLSVTQIVPALLCLVLIVAAPLLIWNLLEEWFTTYTVRDDALVYDTIQGIAIVYPWSAIRAVRRVDPEARESAYEVIVDPAALAQIRNPLLRWLHRQAFGRSRIPIYAHVANRETLLREITTRAGLVPVADMEPEPQPNAGT